MFSLGFITGVIVCVMFMLVISCANVAKDADKKMEKMMSEKGDK